MALCRVQAAVGKEATSLTKPLNHVTFVIHMPWSRLRHLMPRVMVRTPYSRAALFLHAFASNDVFDAYFILGILFHNAADVVSAHWRLTPLIVHEYQIIRFA